MNKPFSANQTALGHVLEAIIVSIVVAVLTAAGQYLAVGHFSIPGLETVVAAAFIAAVLKGWASLQSAPSLLPAVQDTLNQLTASHLNLTQVIGQLVGVVHETSSAQIQQQAPQPVQQVAFPAPSVASVPKLVPPAEDTMPHAALGK